MLDQIPVPVETNADAHECPLTRFASLRLPVFVTPRSSKFLDSVTYQGPKLWANLPNHVKNLNDAFASDREIRKIIHEEFVNGETV